MRLRWKNWSTSFWGTCLPAPLCSTSSLSSHLSSFPSLLNSPLFLFSSLLSLSLSAPLLLFSYVLFSLILFSSPLSPPLSPSLLLIFPLFPLSSLPISPLFYISSPPSLPLPPLARIIDSVNQSLLIFFLMRKCQAVSFLWRLRCWVISGVSSEVPPLCCLLNSSQRSHPKGRLKPHRGKRGLVYTSVWSTLLRVIDSTAGVERFYLMTIWFWLLRQRFGAS